MPKRIEIAINPEGWDEEKQEFVPAKTVALTLEHSLISLSKWESTWHKAFLGKQEKTYEEILDYVKCMTITPNVDDKVYGYLTKRNVDEIYEYISNPMSATYIPPDPRQQANRDTVTSELIYYWMVSFNIPFECEKWHLNRLLTLIRICSVKNAPKKRMSSREVMSRNAALNAARRKAMNTKG